MDSFTLEPIPKIGFTRIVEHIPATAWELADLRFSLNTLSKHYGIRYRIHTIYKPRALYLYRLTENLNLLKFGLWLSSVRTEVSHVQTIFCDRLSETAQFYLYQVHIGTAWPSVRTVFAITHFRAREGNPKYSGMLDIIRTCCHVVRTSCRNFSNNVDWNPTSCRNWRSLT
jgi:hypothetical protein